MASNDQGDQGGAKQPVISIPIDSTEFDALMAKVEKYHETLQKHPQSWAKQEKAISGVHKAASVFGKQMYAQTPFEKAGALMKSPKLNGPDSFISKFEKDSKLIERDWQKIEKHLEKSSKFFASIAQGAAGFGGRGFGLAVGAASALGGAIPAAASSLADMNLKNRQLGLAPGEAQAFDADYAKYGAGDQTLGQANEFKNDYANKGIYLNALGINKDMVSNTGTMGLAQLIAERSAAAYASHKNDPGGADQYFKSMHLEELMGLGQSGAAVEAEHPGSFAATRAQIPQDVKDLAIKQSDLDKASDAAQKFDKVWGEVTNDLKAALTPLMPVAAKLATEFGDAVQAFANSGELKSDLDMLEQGFGDLVGLLKKLHLINDDKTKDSIGKGMDATKKSAWETGNWLEREWPGYKKWREAHSDILGPDSDSDGGVGDGTADDPSKAGGSSPWSMPAVLDAIRQNESSGRLGQRNATTGAAGLYGLMPASAPGVNPDDPLAARVAAQKILEQQLAAHGGNLAQALAGYDGDTHIDADMKKYGGDWLQGAKPETLNYLKRIEKQGVDLNLSKAEQAYLDQHMTDKKLPRDKPLPAGFDATPSIVPYDDATGGGAPKDAQALRDNNRLLAGLTQELSMFGLGLRDTFQAGGGAQYGNQSPAQKGQPYQPVPHFTISTATGSSLNIQAGSLVQ